MVPPLQLNPDAHAAVERFGAIEVVRVDDLLVDPDALRDYAAEHEAEFGPEESAYPGLLLEFPLACQAFAEAFQRFARALTEEPAQAVSTRFGLVCLDPAELKLPQRFPHLDHCDVPETQFFAGVYYLFDRPELGGTGFYTWDPTFYCGPRADESRPTSFAADYSAYLELLERYPHLAAQVPGYVTGDKGPFVFAGRVEAKKNRLVLYPAHVLHSGQIDHPELLSRRVADGRLTLNAFFVCAVAGRRAELAALIADSGGTLTD